MQRFKNTAVRVSLIFCLLLLNTNCGATGANEGNVTIVSVTGPIGGQVVSDPVGIDCDTPDCTHTFADGSVVTMTATPKDGAVFAGWVGNDNCSGVSTCTFTVSQLEYFTAAFSDILYASKRGADGTDSLSTNAIQNIWTMKTDGTDPGAMTANTAAGVVNSQPQWSPDRNWIAYRSNRALDGSDALNTNGTANIWVMRSTGAGNTPGTNLTADNADCNGPVWSPDGVLIAFSSTRALDGSDAANTNSIANIWPVDYASITETALTSNTALGSGNSGPVWSHDGEKIAFVSARALDGSDAAIANSSANLWIMGSDGREATSLTSNTFLNSYLSTPQFSPDDTQIIYTSSQALDQSDTSNTNSNVMNVWTVNLADEVKTPLTSITTLLAHSFNPVWSPDGILIAFTSPRAIDGSDAINTNSATNLWVVDADGNNETPISNLTTANVHASEPQWTPDGTNVLYRSNRALDGTNAANTNLVYNIWFSSPDGATAEPVTELTSDDADSILPQL